MAQNNQNMSSDVINNAIEGTVQQDANGAPCTIVDSDIVQNILAPITIEKPAAGESAEITVQPGQQYFFEFTEDAASSYVQTDGNLEISFEDGSQITLINFGEATIANLPATFAFSTLLNNDDIVVAEQIIETVPAQDELEEPQAEIRETTPAIEETTAQAEPAQTPAQQVASIEPTAGDDIAQQLASLEPAAGDDGSGDAGGFGFQSTFAAGPITPIEDVGPINPTALAFTLPEIDDEITDEPSLLFGDTPPPVIDDTPVVEATTQSIDETNLGPNTVNDTIPADFGNDGPGTFCVKTTGDNFSSDPVTLTSGGEIVSTSTIGDTIIVGTLPNGDEAFRFEITDINTGAYTFTQNIVLDHPDATDPNDIIPLNFVVVAKDADGDTAETTVTINVADDGPAPNARDERTVDENDLPGITINDTIDVDFGQDGAGEITANDTFSATGSVLNNDLSSEGNDVVVTLNGNTYTGTDSNGTVVFTLQITDPATGAYAFTLNQPLDHADPNDPNDIITLNFGVDITDFDGDTAPGTIVINVADSAPVFGGDSVENVDEDNIGSAAASVTGDIDVSSVGSFTLTPDGSNGFSGSAANGELTSNGNDVIVNQTATGYEGVADGETVFTLVIDSDNEEFTFTLLEPLDHADGTDANDEIQLTFGVLVTDSNGNTDNTAIKVDILDSAPSISGSNSVDESDADFDNGVFTSITGNAVTDFGQDGEATVNAITPSSAASFRTEGSVETGTLRHDGIEIDVTLNGDTYTGTAGTVEVFTLTLNTDGSYEFTLKESLDHADRSDPNDVIDLFFGANITDFDGDTTTGEIQISVFDDGPTFLGFTSPTNPGPVTAAPITLAAFAAAPVAAAATTSNSGTAASFADIDESTLENGPQSFDGSLNVDFGNDAPGTILANDTTSFNGTLNGTTLTSGGEEIEITSNAANDIYTGTTESGDVAFTLQITDIENGAYTFTQNLPLDHADDIITINFGVRATDNDGDFVDGAIAVTIGDDVLTIADSAGDVDESNLDVNDEITFEGKLDIEDINAVSNISLDGSFEVLSNGNAVTLTSGRAEVTTQLDGTTTFRGTDSGAAVFTLEIAQDGTFTYTQFLQLGHFDANDENDILQLNFGVNITDADGDVTNSTITINVADDAVVANDDVNGAEEGQTITGDVLSNDDLGVDGQGAIPGFPFVKDITFEGQTFDLTTGPATIVTSLGTLIMNGDGTYEFTATDLGDPDGTVEFTYTATESFDAVDSNDTDTATLSIRVTPDGEPVVDEGEMTVDETDFKNPVLGEDTTTGQLNIDFGIDGAGEVTPNDEVNIIFANNFLGLTSGGDPVDVRATSNGYEAINTVTNEQIFTLTVENDGAFDFDLLQTLDHANPTDPNDNIRFEFGFEVTDGDGDAVQTQIVINVRDDAPVALDDSGLTAVEGTPITGNVLDNDIESEDSPNTVVTISFNGTDTTVPTAGTTISGNFGTLQIAQDGAYTYTPNTNNPDGTDIFTYTLEDSEGDQDTAEFEVTVTPIDDNPGVNSGFEIVDETDLPANNNEITRTGQIDVDFGADAPGTITLVDFNSDGSRLNNALTSNGTPVTTALSNTATGTLYTGTAGGETIFTLALNEDTGAYTFTLLGTLDHADPNNPNDIITLNFTVNAQDADGDITPTSIIVNVLDDVPTIADSAGDVDELDLITGDEVITFSNTLFTDFGAETASILPAGTARAQVNGTTIDLKSLGNDVTITATTNGYVGTIDLAGTPTTVFTLEINPTTGKYDYTQNIALDHLDANDDNDIIDLVFDVNVEANDGTTDTASITISVADEGVIANDDVNGAEEGQLITGSVISNDDLNRDIDNTITQIEFNGTTQDIPTGGSVDVTASLGTLTINSDGTYTFIATDLGDPDGTDLFTYTLTDGDGDSDTATLSIRVTPDGEPVVDQGEMTVDETDFKNPVLGEDTTTGQLNIDFGIDGQGSVTPNGSIARAGGGTSLTSGGDPVDVRATSNGYEAINTVTNEQVFTLTVENDGSFDFDLLQTLDHADPTDPNDNIRFEFGFEVTDSDGDAVQTQIVINVRDDAPVAIDDDTSAIEGTPITGNVLDNDIESEDSPNTVVTISFNGTDTSVPTAGAAITGDFGTLQIAQDGAYTYTPNTNNPDGTDIFTYTLQDSEGDQDTAEFEVAVTPVNDTPLPTAQTENVDEDDLNISEDGVIPVDFGRDAPGTFCVKTTGTNFTSSVGTLTSGGDAVTILTQGDTAIVGLVGSIEIFRFEITDIDAGTYLYTQTAPLDHPDTTDPNDVIALNFTIVAKDADGDQSEGIVTINVSDSGPIADNDTNTVDAGGNVPGDLLENDETGQDTPASITVEGTQITSNGTTINGQFGVLTINTNGTYTYQANAVTSGGVETFDYVLTDFDGDSDPATLTITVNASNDVPEAVNDSKTLNDGNSVSDNVFDNDDKGDDTPTTVTHIQFGSTIVNVPSSGSVNITGNSGTLTISADGEYTYQSNENDVADTATDFFTYTITDNNGDSDTATLAVTVVDNDGPIAVDDNASVADGASIPGEVISNDTVGVDAPGIINAIRTDNGSFVSVPSSGRTITGDLGTLTIRQDGSYTYTANNNNPGGVDDFVYRLADNDGDTATARLRINVGADDRPDARDDSASVNDGERVGTNNVLNNDDRGNDTPTIVTRIQFGSQSVTVPSSGSRSIDGDFGTLTISANGNYTYNAFENRVASSATDTFTYTIRDADGDTDSARLRVTVRDNDAPDAADDSASVNDGSSVGGNIIDNDSVGADVNGIIDEVWFGNTVVAIPTSGSTNIDGNFGRLTVSANGDYSYRAFENRVANTATDAFGYRLRDNDGDHDTATIRITVRDNDAPVAHNDFLTDSEGKVRKITGSVSGFVRGNDIRSADVDNDVTQIAFGNTRLDIPATGDVSIRGASGTLTINANGRYTFVQDTPGENQRINAARNEFTYTLTDRDGDSDTAILVINTAVRIGPRDADDTPLVIDIDQDGIELVSKEDGVLFDLGPDGVLDQTGWVAADDGFLALDINNDGIINDHSELFGTRTIDGFTILAQHDSNNDGVIDANDDVFEDLVVWQDLNQNGYSEANELNGLEIYGIKSIDLDAEDSDEIIAGNEIILDGRLTYDDGSEGDIVDAVFAADALETLYAGEGADTFAFDVILDNPTAIKGFNAEESDVIDISSLIRGADALDQAIEDFVFADQQGKHTVVSTNLTGEMQAIAVLENTQGLNVNDIIKETIAA